MLLDCLARLSFISGLFPILRVHYDVARPIGLKNWPPEEFKFEFKSFGLDSEERRPFCLVMLR